MKERKLFQKLFIGGFVLISGLLVNQKSLAQESCPEYTRHYEYERRIKFCRTGEYFVTWEDCTFRLEGMCPCPTIHEQSCLGEA